MSYRLKIKVLQWQAVTWTEGSQYSI